MTTNQEEMNKLLELFFEQKNVLYEHLFSSYDQFVREMIPHLLIQENNIFYENVDKEKIYLHGFKCSNIRIKPSTFDNNNELKFPSDARKNHLNYFASIIADVQQYVETLNTVTGDKSTSLVGEIERETPIGNIPVMVKSKYCSTNIKQDLKGECKYDPGGYFIVNGSEKVIMSIEKIVDNKILVFSKKDSSYDNGIQYIAQINSKANDWADNLQILTIKCRKNGVLTLNTSSQLVDVPLFILFRALGIEDDRNIISRITYDLEDTRMLNIIRPSVMFSTDDMDNQVKTKEEAIEFLITKLRRNKRISQTDEDIAKIQKRLYLDKVIRHDLLPHLGEDIPKKIAFLGLMANRLLSVILSERELDDRDALQNKRIETPGILLGQLFRQNWKKLLNEINKNFRKKNQNDEKPINVVNQIKASTIEQGIKTALATGIWGMNKTKKGVAQALQRLSWIQGISYLRRIMSPSMEESTSKVTTIRKTSTNQTQMLCLTGDTEIVMGNSYNIKHIKDVTDGSNVVTINIKNQDETSSLIHNSFNRMANNLLQLETTSGRIIKATPEHPFMINNNGTVEWKQLGDIKSTDNILIRPTEKMLEETIDDTDDMSYDKGDIHGMSYDKLQIIARLIGLIIGSSSNGPKLKIKSLNDLNILVNDASLLGYEGCLKIKKEQQYEVELTSSFAYAIKTLGGFTDWYNVSVPDWIMNCDKVIKREFLSGLFSGLNAKIMFNSITDIYIQLHQKNLLLQYANDKVSLTSANIFTNRLVVLLNELGIDAIQHPLSTGDKMVGMGVMINHTVANMIKYTDVIGFRYCEDLRKESVVPIEYMRLIKETQEGNMIIRTCHINMNDFMSMNKLNNGYVSIGIKEIKEIEPEMVYDFTTVSDNHSFIASSFCSSNCPVDTPEGANIGIVKTLAMTSSISMQNMSQMEVIKSVLNPNKHIKHPFDIDPLTMKEHVKIFANGNWFGVTKLGHAHDIFKLLKNKRKEGIIDKTTSILLDTVNKEIRMFFDGGRLVRPLLIVNNNNINITSELKADIENELKQVDKSKSFKKIMSKYINLIEYEDIESLNYLLVCDEESKLDVNKKIKGTEIKESTDGMINRHGDTKWINYTHSDFHPWTMLGCVASNIPFSNHNYGNRNTIHFSQSKQAIGVYLSSYKDRMDISQILYNPQVPLVQTQGMKYNGCLDLPYGENAIVAICSYTGFNQEDSIIFNQSAIDRGIFRADTIKKDSSVIEKNPSTSQDDIFTKPDRNKVTGMKHGSYEKLNDKGYVPEETEINNEDIIIGKISPMQPTGNNNKVYKDSSKIFKSNIPGVIDRVHTGVYNAEGYEMYNMRIRLERKPIVGDKFSSRHSQKGTIGIIYKQKDMPFTESGIVPDLILNPHGFPTRMSVAHFIETLASKEAAETGNFVDGTPFNDYDVSQLPVALKKLGYSPFGTEVMYCGITGRKMDAEIFIGPSYNIRLKHMVQDKVHGRARGPKQALTRQPLEGRSKDGGLKIGKPFCLIVFMQI